MRRRQADNEQRRERRRRKMENQAVEAMALAGSTNLDFSVVALFMKADLVVKSVIVMLVAASIWCWAIIIEKSISVRRLNKRSDKFEDRFWSGDSLDNLYDKIGTRPGDPMSAVFAAAMREWRRATPNGGGTSASLAQRIDRVMQITADRAAGRVTVPSLLNLELKTNPFLRADDPSLQAIISMVGKKPVEVFAKIRGLKDNF